MRGIYSDISNKDYHEIEAISASGMKLLRRTPAHYKCSLHEETPALKTGSALHCAVLEPERFSLEYIEAPDIDKRTKEGKKAFAELEASGKIALTKEEYTNVTGMAKSIHSHEIAGQLVIGGRAEHSIFWDKNILLNGGAEVAVPCKARPDFIKESDGCYHIIDIKTAEDARPYAFTRAAYDYGYHIQAAHYFNGCTSILDMPVGEFAFIVVEKKPPYAVVVYVANQDFMNVGQSQCSQLISLYAKCSAEDKWPAYTDEIIELGVPAWAK